MPVQQEQEQRHPTRRLNTLAAHLTAAIVDVEATKQRYIKERERRLRSEGVDQYQKAEGLVQVEDRFADPEAIKARKAMKIVDEDAEGVTVRGAKMLGTSSIMANEVFVAHLQPLFDVIFRVLLTARG